MAWWLGHMNTVFQEILFTTPPSVPKGTLTWAQALGQGSDQAFSPSSTESQNLPKQPPLMLALGQASECLRLMARAGLGSCSFARVDDYLH